MMKLSEYHGEEALDLFADLLEPASEIMADKEFVEHARSGNMMKAVKTAVKGHKKAVIEILARVDGADPDNYEVNVFTIPVKALELLNDEALKDLFISQGQKKTSESSGSATENTKAEEA